jgi:NADP-dependent 3-hydroxy acid dehydrogenase YdfG
LSFASYPSLNGQVVFITGGGSGIGAALVEAFAAQGARVAFVDILEAESRALAERLRGAQTPPLFLPCDLVDIAALGAAIAEVRERLGPIGVLVNNAGNDDRQPVEAVAEADWDRAMALNLKHQFFAAKAVRPQMRELGGGSIVNFSSIAWMHGGASMVAYATAKAAIVGLTNSRARSHPRQRDRPRRGDHRAAATAVDQRARARGDRRSPMPGARADPRRDRPRRAVPRLGRQRHDHQAMPDRRRRPALRPAPLASSVRRASPVAAPMTPAVDPAMPVVIAADAAAERPDMGAEEAARRLDLRVRSQGRRRRRHRRLGGRGGRDQQADSHRRRGAEAGQIAEFHDFSLGFWRLGPPRAGALKTAVRERDRAQAATASLDADRPVRQSRNLLMGGPARPTTWPKSRVRPSTCSSATRTRRNRLRRPSIHRRDPPIILPPSPGSGSR